MYEHSELNSNLRTYNEFIYTKFTDVFDFNNWKKRDDATLLNLYDANAVNSPPSSDGMISGILKTIMFSGTILQEFTNQHNIKYYRLFWYIQWSEWTNILAERDLIASWSNNVINIDANNGFTGNIYYLYNKNVLFLYGIVDIGSSTTIWQNIATLQVQPKEHMFFYVDTLPDSSGHVYKKRFVINTAGGFQLADTNFISGETYFFNQLIPLL